MTTKLLANQYRSILADPVEGFTVELLDEASLYEWKVFLEGPKDTCYESGVFELRLSFPKDYPMSPPTLKFISDFWHPNVYNDGKVCMSILHPPGEDAMSGELAEERWLPTQSVTTIVLSLMSLLNDPNCSSPANVDASVEWRKNRDSYVNKCRKLAEKANREKPPHIVIPHPDTNEDEHKKIVQKWKEMNTELDYEDFYEHHEESESDDENENEFLESNEEINSENSEEEEQEETEKHKKKKKQEHSAEKNDKGKTPELSLEAAKGESSSKPSSDSALIANSTEITKTDTVTTNPPPATLPPEKSAEPPENAVEKSGPSAIPPPRDAINSPAPVHIPASPSVNNSEEISVDNNNNNNASSSGSETKKQKKGKTKKEKKEKKKKCIVM